MKNTEQDSGVEKKPDLSLDKETLDFLAQHLLDYGPAGHSFENSNCVKISAMLASKTGGFKNANNQE